MGCDGLKLARLWLAWLHEVTAKPPNSVDEEAAALLPCSLTWSQARPLLGEILSSRFPRSLANKNHLYFKPGTWNLP